MFSSFVDIFSENPLGQVLWFIWTIVVLSAYLQKDDSRTVRILMVSKIFWILHFYLIGLYAACFIAMIGWGRMLLSLKYKKNHKVFFGVLSVTILIGILTYEDHYSLLPIIAGIISTYGYFFLEKARLRTLFLLTSMMWLTYSYRNGSVWGVINEVMMLTTLSYSIYRLSWIKWSQWYYIGRVKDIIFHKPVIDYDRYVAIPDFINNIKKHSWITYLRNSWRESNRSIVWKSKKT